MTKNHWYSWLRNVFIPYMPDRALLLIDAYTVYDIEAAIEMARKAGKQLFIKRIPPKCTPLIQPCDVGLFRTWKSIDRKITDFVLLHELEPKMYQRQNIIFRQSLIHNQLSSPIFKNFIKYSFYKPGFISQHPPEYIDPIKFCFSNISEYCYKSQTNECEEFSFIKCSHCHFDLCFHHFFTERHYCRS